MKIRILYAEDNSNWAESTRILLELYGFQVDIARNGDEAWAMYYNQKPDILLLDLEMPGRDVLRLVEDIKKVKDTTTIVVYSVHVESARSVLAVRLGIDDYFEKGFNTTLFAERMRCIGLRSLKRLRDPNLIELSSCTVYNRMSGILTCDGKDIYLKHLDSLLLELLAIRLNQWVDKVYLCQGMWGDRVGKELKKYVSHLRKILLADPELKIENRSVGWYCLRNKVGENLL